MIWQIDMTKVNMQNAVNVDCTANTPNVLILMNVEKTTTPFVVKGVKVMKDGTEVGQLKKVGSAWILTFTPTAGRHEVVCSTMLDGQDWADQVAMFALQISEV